MDPQLAHQTTPVHDEPPAPARPIVAPRGLRPLPSVLLPAQPFRAGAARHGTNVMIEGASLPDDPGYRPIPSLREFHLAVSDRRRAERDRPDRRNEPRPYASPWMATPVDGTIDPRPDTSPHEAGPPIIRPLDTIVPNIPLEASAQPGHAAAPTSAQAGSGHPAATACAPQPATPVAAAAATQPTSTSDPLDGIFGAPSAVRLAVINPAAWFPQAQAPAAQTPADVPDPAILPVQQQRQSSPWADVEPTAIAVHAAVPVAPASPGPLASVIADEIALRPLAPPTEYDDAGSFPLRVAWLVAVPAIAGGGIGYLLSIVLR